MYPAPLPLDVPRPLTSWCTPPPYLLMYPATLPLESRSSNPFLFHITSLSLSCYLSLFLDLPSFIWPFLIPFSLSYTSLSLSLFLWLYFSLLLNLPFNISISIFWPLLYHYVSFSRSLLLFLISATLSFPLLSFLDLSRFTFSHSLFLSFSRLLSLSIGLSLSLSFSSSFFFCMSTEKCLLKVQKLVNFSSLYIFFQ